MAIDSWWDEKPSWGLGNVDWHFCHVSRHNEVERHSQRGPTALPWIKIPESTLCGWKTKFNVSWKCFKKCGQKLHEHIRLKQLVTLNGFRMSAEFRSVPAHEEAISTVQHSGCAEQNDLSAVGGPTLKARSICMFPTSLNSPARADK